MIEKMRDILRKGSLCVLATSLDDRPHCSLMSYITDPGAETIYMATLGSSRKFANLMQNPHVSILIDTRDFARKVAEISALTVTGAFRPIAENERKQEILMRITEKHRHLQAVCSHPDAEVVAVRIESFQLLAGPSQAYYETV